MTIIWEGYFFMRIMKTINNFLYIKNSLAFKHLLQIFFIRILDNDSKIKKESRKESRKGERKKISN